MPDMSENEKVVEYCVSRIGFLHHLDQEEIELRIKNSLEEKDLQLCGLREVVEDAKYALQRASAHFRGYCKCSGGEWCKVESYIDEALQKYKERG